MAPSPDSASQYDHEVEHLFADLLGRFDAFDPDEVEAEAAQGVIKLQFADGSRCVLNRQSAAQQVWLAEGATAWHFVFDAARREWTDTKGRGDLRGILGEVVGRKLGRPVEFR